MTACSYTPAANRVPKANGSGLLASGWFTGIFVPTGPITVSGLTVSSTDKVLGRQSASGGAIEEITCTAAGRALLDDANAAAQRVTLGLGPSDSVTFDILTATTRVQTPVLRATGAGGVQVQASTGTLCVTFGLSGSPCAVFADGASFSGQVNATHSGGIITQQAATQDAIQILGRAGGTGSYVATLQPPTLASNIVITLPAATTDLGTGVFATSAFGTDNRILRSDGTGRLAQSSAITVDDSGNLSGAASVVIGTDPTGSELLRVGGAAKISATAYSGTALLVDGAPSYFAAKFRIGSDNNLAIRRNADFGAFTGMALDCRNDADSASMDLRFRALSYTFTEGKLVVENSTDATSATDTSASLNTAGGLAVAKAAYAGSQFNVANKFRIHYDSVTGEYGPQIKLTNKTGGNSVKGDIVRAATGTDMAFIQAPASSDEPIGVVYEAGVADASDAWIWAAGAVCQVLIKDGTAATRGNWAFVSDTAGRADMTNADPIGATEHTREIGHCLETKGSGTSVLARATLHFN